MMTNTLTPERLREIRKTFAYRALPMDEVFALPAWFVVYLDMSDWTIEKLTALAKRRVITSYMGIPITDFPFEL